MRLFLFAAAIAALSPTIAAAQQRPRPTPWWQRQAPEPEKPKADQRENMESPLPSHARLGYFNELLLNTEPDGGAGNVFEFRPDIPIGSEDVWGVLHSGALPIIYLSDEVAGDSSEMGVGDARYSFLLTRRARANGPDSGFGVALTLPTASDAALGFKRLTLGPQVAAVWSSSVWRYGFTGVQRWSVSGSDKGEPVSQTTLEPFVYLNLDEGWYAFSRPTLRADWEREDDKVSIPVGAGMGRVLDMGEGRPLDVQASFYTSLTDAVGEPKWVLRVQVQTYIGR